MSRTTSSLKSVVLRSLLVYVLLILVSSQLGPRTSAYHVDNNKLSSVGSASPMTTVRTLRINDNQISAVDMSNFPKLRTLYADGNCISRLSRSGFETSRLENLSLRNQRCSQLRLSRSELSPVKRLYVSGKHISVFKTYELIFR
jgi:Leucine-rich repeat (LRR) protein